MTMYNRIANPPFGGKCCDKPETPKTPALLGAALTRVVHHCIWSITKKSMEFARGANAVVTAERGSITSIRCGDSRVELVS